ncbi:MAG TPA: hypothetical protein DCG39_00195, partial [Opitutae bacterium]|nr:hypothetical protein [Opitutae bacterium]
EVSLLYVKVASSSTVIGVDVNLTGNGTNVEEKINFDFVEAPVGSVITCCLRVSLGDRSVNETIDGEVFVDFDSGNGSHQTESNQHS